MKSGSWRTPLRIVHTVSSLKFGGMEQFVVRLAGAQAKQGHHVSVLALRGGPLADDLGAASVKAFVLDGQSSAWRFTRGVARLALARPHIIHCHNSPSLRYAVSGKLAAAAKLILTVHGECMGDVRQCSEWELRQIDTVVGVSTDVANRSYTRYGAYSPWTVIPNGVTPGTPQRSREEVRRELNLPTGPTAIVVARLDPVKDQETLLRAAAMLNASGIAMNVLIVGDGSERERLEQLLPELGLSRDRIRFLGFRTDVPDLLLASDLFVLSSLQEGLPLATLEAMAQGLAVVQTAVGGVPELIEHGRNGLLVPKQQPESLAQAIRNVIADPALGRALAEAGRHTVFTEYSFEHMVQRYEELYQKCRSSSQLACGAAPSSESSVRPEPVAAHPDRGFSMPEHRR